MSTQTLLPESHARLLQTIHAIGLTDHQRATLAPMVDEICESVTRRRKTLTLISESISQLRLDIKYLCFDLEATRRERDDYKKKLDL